MIRLKQKKAEAQKKEEKATETAAATSSDETSSSSEPAAPAGLKLFSVGGVQNEKTGDKKAGKKRTPGEIRIQKDISDLDGGSVAKVSFPNPNDLTNFQVTVHPDGGLWNGARYHFTFVIPALYPHEAPKVTCQTRIYHPNINLQGNVCLNILREDWKPVLDINAVIYGLIYLFHEPNPDDPLNREAADLYRNDKAQFARMVKKTLQGGTHFGTDFEKLT